MELKRRLDVALFADPAGDLVDGSFEHENCVLVRKMDAVWAEKADIDGGARDVVVVWVESRANKLMSEGLRSDGKQYLRSEIRGRWKLKCNIGT